jgi:hypothetical protein
MLLDYCPKTLLDMMQASNFNLDPFFIYEVCAAWLMQAVKSYTLQTYVIVIWLLRLW